MKSEPDFDIDYAAGRQAELAVVSLRRSLAEGRVEVKQDRDFVNTGNIYVETACHYPRRGTVPTGISNPSSALTWVYDLRGTGVMVVFDLAQLRRLAAHPIAQPSFTRRGDHPTDGVLLALRKVFTPGVLG